MTEEEILSELRTIRTLLTLDKEQELTDIVDDLTEIQQLLLDEIPDDEWASIPTSEIADEFDVSNRTVQKHLNELQEESLVEKRGQSRGTEYRITGLLRAAELTIRE